MAKAIYAIAIGSNRRGGAGAPRKVVAAAIAALDGVRAVSGIHDTAPVGPSIRRYANAVVLVESGDAPELLLATLKTIERRFGRRRGQRWGARVIDLDIVLWSGGAWSACGLTVPHVAFRQRGFVLVPLREVAAHWRDPVTGLRIRHLASRLARPRPVDRSRRRA